MQQSDQKQGHLLRNILLFGRLLRGAGIQTTPTQILDLVEGLKHIDLNRREDFKSSARTILVNRHEQISLFDRAFDLFWQARNSGTLTDLNLKDLLPEIENTEKQIESTPSNHSEHDLPERESNTPIIDQIYAYSDREVLRHKDFSEFSQKELEEVKHLIQSMNWQLEKRRTRRKMRASHGRHLDMRRTFRQNLKYGGEPLTLSWQNRKLKRRPLVVISDISGSMERYARVLMKFIYAISNGLDHVESFVFSTQLTRITHQLRHRDIDLALNQATSEIHDWAGGTRIGDSLKTFNMKWGRRVLGQGAIVLIISDGWDRGQPEILSHELSRIQLSCQRLIWLNPLLGMATYEPLSQGIQAALPYIDNFLPIHNLESLEQLGVLLEKLGESKPNRHQHKYGA